MARGGRTHRLHNILFQTQNAPYKGDNREVSRADESIHQTVQNPRHRHEATNDSYADRPAETLDALFQRQQNIDTFSIEQAKRLGARVFNSKDDPLDADNWMTQLEIVFDVM
ncbi:Uncharacterized protein Adt_04274 [Abeliophyllum distichum]|uniref:Uncharacterized protein n=1 Tax=Abeliophyllum distichum TaxID=126358 RepID=A0ABD1W0Z9_9LAMI